MSHRIKYDLPYLDEEERETMEALNLAMERGEINPPSEKDRLQLNARWQKVVQKMRSRASTT